MDLHAICLKVEKFHKAGYDVVVLAHKSNSKRSTWRHYGTPAAGEEFLEKHKEVVELWKKHITNGVLHIYCLILKL